MLERSEQDHLLALLAWWREAGVDAVLDEATIDWTGDPARWPGVGFAWPQTDAAASNESVAAGTLPQSAIRPSQTSSARMPSRPPVTGQTAPSRAPPPGMPPPRPTMAPPDAGRSDEPSQPRAFPRLAPDAATMAAREVARKAPTLEALETALQAFDGCGLKATAKNLCFYRGSAQARLMLIGEAPGREEDLEGKPFVGRSGQLLDKMLAAIGCTQADVHITNTVYWRPPGNRTPTPQETLVCRPFLERQIELARPDIIATLGGPAAKAVLDVTDGILKIRGKWRQLTIDGRSVRVMPTLHPAYLLRTPIQKKLAWRDLRAIKAALEGKS